MSARETELVDVKPVEILPRDDNSSLETDSLIPQTGPEKLTEKELRILKSSTFEDMCGAALDAKILAPLAAVVCALIAMYFAIDPFGDYVKPPTPMTKDEFKLIRPVLSVDEQARIYVNTMYAETKFSLPEPMYDIVSAKFQTVASKNGHHQLPEIFYTGVIYGISAENSHGLEYGDRRRLSPMTSDEEFLADLKHDLETMEPKPTYVFERESFNEETGWSEKGLAVHFSLDDLKAQGYLSSDVHAPFKRTVEPVLDVARKHRQVLVTQWFPSKFGRQDVPAVEANAHRHTTIVRQVLPTRTGMGGIKSTGAVWLAAVNDSEPVIPPQMIRKMWTAEDHWTHYPMEKSKGDKVFDDE